jgi:hypothetical protein
MTKVAPVADSSARDKSAALPDRRPAAILSPAIDALCTGGLSLVLFAAMIAAALLWQVTFNSPQVRGFLLVATALLNWPHFMASYRLLYGSPESRRRYPWASVIVPALLVAYCLAALAVPVVTKPVDATSGSGIFVDQTMFRALFVINLFYLAWHYTGQGWGMCASFAYLQGLRFEPRERQLVRSGFRALLVVHVVAVLAGLADVFPEMLSIVEPEVLSTVKKVQPWTLLAAALTIPLGLAGFALAWRRTGLRPGVRTVVPWGSLYVWYAMLPIVPDSFVWLQLAHALQYLEFPLRVELNRRDLRQSRPPRGKTTRLPRAGYVGLYYGGLFAARMFTFASPYLIGFQLAMLVAAAVNVHHYFVDGCIWKISNPAVRGELFAHLAK